MRTRWVPFVAVWVGLFVATSCKEVRPVSHPEAKCMYGCNKRASAKCSEDACERGCRFILDRLIEREGGNVLRCVAASPGGCDDRVWADCAARVGWLADGGPPSPPPPPEGFDDE